MTSGHGAADAAMLIEAGLFDINDARWSFGVDAFDPDTWLEIEAVIPHPAFIPGRPAPTQIDIGIVILKHPV
jgi:hypothetical protein